MFGHKFANVIFDVQITVSRRFILVMRRNILRTRESLLLFLLFIRFRYVQITTGHWYRMQVNKRGDVLWRRKLEQFHPDFTIFFPPSPPSKNCSTNPSRFFPFSQRRIGLLSDFLLENWRSNCGWRTRIEVSDEENINRDRGTIMD